MNKHIESQPRDMSLNEFEAWCRGVGRGPRPGIHYNTLKHIESFRQFKQCQQEMRHG